MKTPDLCPNDPMNFAIEIKVPVLGLYSGIDAFVKQETIAKMRGLIDKGMHSRRNYAKQELLSR